VIEQPAFDAAARASDTPPLEERPPARAAGRERCGGRARVSAAARSSGSDGRIFAGRVHRGPVRRRRGRRGARNPIFPS